MAKMHDPHGWAAFKAALGAQEGRFMREATFIMNEPKDMSFKNKSSDNENIAGALLERNARGQFVKRGED